MAAINRQQEFERPRGKVLLIARRHVDLAFDGAAGTLRADSDVVIQCDAIVRVFQDSGEGFQERRARLLLQSLPRGIEPASAACG